MRLYKESYTEHQYVDSAQHSERFSEAIPLETIDQIKLNFFVCQLISVVLSKITNLLEKWQEDCKQS